jgi:hypothetical protein
MSDDLVARLRHAWDERERQLDEDERVALAVIGVNAHADLINGKPPAHWEMPPDSSSIYSTERIPILRVRHTWKRESGHITRHDPARVLAEVERGRRDIAAKRHILDRYEDALARQQDPEYSQISAHIEAEEYEGWIIPELAAAEGLV